MNKLGSWKEWTKKRKYIVFLGIGVPILCVAAIYFKGLSFYKNHFVNGTRSEERRVGKECRL